MKEPSGPVMARIYDTFGRKFGSQREAPPPILDFEVKKHSFDYLHKMYTKIYFEFYRMKIIQNVELYVRNSFLLR